MGRKTKGAVQKFTVPPVWRQIVKKNERQGSARFDVLVCDHAVPADPENTHRRVRACPECRCRVQDYADLHPPRKKTA
jgi:hypothetical protein